MDGQKLRIAEVFSSIQGEGIWSGVPSTFVRVSGCNLRCVWCDTPYASCTPEGDFWEVSDLVVNVNGFGNLHVVVTGGEPMLFDSTEELCENVAGKVTIETAGTVFRSLRCDLMSISPKLANSTPPEESGWRQRHEKTRLNVPVLSQLIETYNHQLKFVVGDSLTEDVRQIQALLAQLPKVDADRILLMPEGTDSVTLHRRMTPLVPVCLEHGWRLSPRLHVDLFGNKRGT